MLFESALTLPSVSAQGENTPTPTPTPNPSSALLRWVSLSATSYGVNGATPHSNTYTSSALEGNDLWFKATGSGRCDEGNGTQSVGCSALNSGVRLKNISPNTVTLYWRLTTTSSHPNNLVSRAGYGGNYGVFPQNVNLTNASYIRQLEPNGETTIDVAMTSFLYSAPMPANTNFLADVYIRVSVYPIDTAFPPYDCSGTTLSSVAQAVLAEVGEQEYCGNHYDRLITLPPGQPAFERYGSLASSARYEVDFVTMGWDQDKVAADNDSPGDFFIQGVKDLYEQVQDPVGHGKSVDYFAGGVQVRILLGLRYYFKSPQDQRLIVLDDLADLNIPTQDTNWSVVVASYRNDSMLSGKHSHVKMMIVDGKHVVASGYNLHYDYLEDVPEENQFPVHDMGVEVSGPIALLALEVFDGLWLGASGCQKDIFVFCSTITDIPHHTAILTPNTMGNDVVFSLFRDDTDKTADNAIEVAINAAGSEVKVIQNRFMNDFWYPPQYARAILNALEKGNGQVAVNLLVSGVGNDSGLNINDLRLNIAGVCNLKDQLLHEDPIGTHHLVTKFSSQTNPIHTKALSIDGTFIIVGSQNFDQSAWGNDNSLPYGDLSEYSLGVSSIAAANDFNNKFNEEFDPANGAHDILCLNSLYSQSALQDAINQASPGSAMFIPAGVYTASVTINKPLVLVGAGNQTIIQPQGNGPAFRITSSDVVISSMRISGGDGYGIELVDSSPSSLKDIQINRVVFENNTQGGVLAKGLIPGSPMNYVIENNTFIGGADGVTINMVETQTDTSFVRNNIFFGQSNAPIHILSTDDSRVEYSYNLFDDCGLGACTTNWRLGNMNASSSAHDNLFDLNPLFASPANGAYQLSSGSPAIDAGDPSLLHDLFFDGDNDGTIQIDIGAFEYAQITNVSPVVNAGNDQTVNLGNSVTVNATYSDADNSENHSAKIDWGDGTVEDVAVNMTGPGAGQVTGQHTYASPGTYTVEVCVTDLHGGVGCDTINVQVISTPNACTPSNSYGQSQGEYHFASFKPTSSLTDFNQLPLSFVPNMGQEDQAVRFQVQGLGGRLFFAPSEVVFSLPNPVKVSPQNNDDKEKIRYDLHPANVVRIHYQGANSAPEIAGTGELPGVVNVLKGNNPSKWRTNLPTYSGIAYRELYPGIELRYEGTDGKLKSTFNVAPGADPSAIIWRYKGASDVNIDASGNLVVSLPEPAGNGAVLIERAPIAWQEVNGNRVMIPVQYSVDKKDKKVSFLLPEGYDSTLPLVIDPELTYSAYLGGGHNDEGNAITLDADCNVYLTGSTYSTDFPTTNPLQTNLPGSDVFVSKLNAAGNTLLYSTYIGGSGGDNAWDIALDSQGRITIVGETESSDFPTPNAYDNSYESGTCDGDPCDDVFVTQLLADGSALRYSSYMGGISDDEAYGMVLGPDDMIYLTGFTKSSTFPTVNAHDTSFGGGTCSGAPCPDGFVAKVNPSLSGVNSLLYSTYLGGNNYDKSNDIAVDASGRVYVTGYTRSNNFPTLNPYQPARASAADAFVSKFDTTLSGAASLLYSTYFGGGSTDQGTGIALNGADQVYLTGFTSSANFPLANALDNAVGGTDAFITHLNIASNSLAYSTYLGGSNEAKGESITVDDSGNAYITGYTKSTDFTTLAAIQPTKGTDSCSAPPCSDAFVTKVNPAGSALVYSTYLGGGSEDYGNMIVLDGLGGAYIVGYTFSTDFPVTLDLSVGNNSYSDAFVVKIDD